MGNRGAKPGERRGGRQKGTVNKQTANVMEILSRLNCDPIEGMAKIASGEIRCGTCHGKGKTKYKVEGKINESVCESCYGSLMEKITPDLRGRMYSELAK